MKRAVGGTAVLAGVLAGGAVASRRRWARRMTSTKPQGIYLDDHLAGATAGVELAEKLRSSNQGTALGTALAGLVQDIRQDRATLEELMERLDVHKNPVKQVVGWVSEKLTRLRLNERLTGDADLTRLLEIEALSLGIEGKLALWRALKAVAELDARLAGTDLDGLIDRARRQRETLEPYRLEAAAKAFSP